MKHTAKILTWYRDRLYAAGEQILVLKGDEQFFGLEAEVEPEPETPATIITKRVKSAQTGVLDT